jgi:hypothetical protein
MEYEMNLESTNNELRMVCARLCKALDEISMIPDKGGDRATLEAAVAIARRALPEDYLSGKGLWKRLKTLQ